MINQPTLDEIDRDETKSLRGSEKCNHSATKNAIITLRSHKDLDETDIKILILLIDNNKDFSQTQLAEHCKVSSACICRHLSKLRKKAYITQIQSGKPNIHKPTKKGYNVGCMFLRGYEGDHKDRLHNIKAHCTFKIKKGNGELKWESYAMQNWNKFFTWIEQVYIWYSDKGNTIHYNLPHIFANTASDAIEKAFELIRMVNKKLKKDGIVFTSRPEIDHENITITDNHHAAFMDPIAIWLKEQGISIKYQDMVEFDSSFKDQPEMDLTKFPYNQEHFERYMTWAIKIMKGELKAEDLKEMPELQKFATSLLMVQGKKVSNIEEAIEELKKAMEVSLKSQALIHNEFGQVTTGNMTQLQYMTNLIQGMGDLDKRMDKIETEMSKEDKVFLIIERVIERLNKPTFINIYRVLKKDMNFVELSILLSYHVSKGNLIYKNGVYRLKE